MNQLAIFRDLVGTSHFLIQSGADIHAGDVKNV